MANADVRAPGIVPAVVCVCLVILAAVAPPVLAQEAASSAQTLPPVAETRAAAKHPTRIYVTMWTLHLKEKPALDNNWLVGVSARGWFGATFVNSYGRRGFSAGLQRSLISAGDGPLRATLGYRLGVVTGYDGRLADFARKAPALPLIQPFFVVDLFHVGYEVSYTFVVVSAQVSYRF